MGFFKDFKKDFFQAAQELMLDDAEENTMEENAIKENAIKESAVKESAVNEDSIRDSGMAAKETEQNAGAFEKEVHQAAELLQQDELKQNTDMMKDEVTKVEKEEPKVQEEKVMVENMMPVNMESEDIKLPPGSDEVSIITRGMIIKGDVITTGSLDIRGEIHGNVTCNGKIMLTGMINGNSNATEFYADAARVEGEIVSTGKTKIGLGTVVVGNLASSSAVVAGAIKGNIDVQGPVLVDNSAVVVGNICSRSIQINNGAVVQGFISQSHTDIDMNSLFGTKEGK